MIPSHIRAKILVCYLNVEQFVALKMHLKTEDVELLVKRGLGGEDKVIETLPASAAVSKDEMQSLEEDNETLSKLKTDFNSSQEHHLVLASIYLFIILIPCMIQLSEKIFLIWFCFFSDHSLQAEANRVKKLGV